jgi:hypothetical protein
MGFIINSRKRRYRIGSAFARPRAAKLTPASKRRRKQVANNFRISAKKGGVHALTLDGRKIVLNVRSVEGVIYYLGEWVRQEFFHMGEDPRAPPTIFSQHRHCRQGDRDILFHLERGEGQNPSISTTYEGDTYNIRVDPSGCDRSSQVMELVLELLALNNSAKDLPAPSVIPVLTR